MKEKTTMTKTMTDRIDLDLVDQLLKDYKQPEDILGENGILKQFTKALLERAMQVEMSEHLGYERHDSSGDNSGNSRNGSSEKTLKGDFGALPIEVPRDRNAEFEPKIVPKGKTRLDGFNEKMLSLYARGMTVREIQQHIQEIYKVEVSPTLISNVTEAVMEDVVAWQNRPLEAIYPILYMDALQVKVRDGAHVVNKAVHLAIGVTLAGNKDVLGLWLGQTEGAKLWLQIVTELKNRGVKDIFIACVDGLKGFPEAIESVFPKAQVQLCIVHMVRHSLNFVGYKQRKEVATDLQKIYRAATRDEAELRLAEFAEKWDAKYPTISQAWHRNWERLTPFLAYPEEIRRVIYTTNAVESVNMSLRKIIKNRGSFPTDESALKLLYLALRNITTRWTMPVKDWRAALNRFAIIFEDRMPTF
jgi:putative transposase